ncbi:uncharacterized protein LOC121903404 [Scomber scombrus]|uniref:Uncharacterized protein LOC121903404 n=1 Tax=Scomber scombrus TaxID=13677 RepID=A0AAV1Q8J2_SCOSC
MNPYSDTNLNSHPRDATAPTTPPFSAHERHNSHNPSLSSTFSPVILTGRSSLTVLRNIPSVYQSSSEQDGAQNLDWSPNSGHTALPLPSSSQTPVPGSTLLNPYAAPTTPPSSQVSIIVPSPDVRPSPLLSQCSEESCPDLECAICFSQFNNVFRCPKMLQCKHTFCLECLARINVKSREPDAIQCPLCRSFTPLPTLGLPKLTTDPDVLSYLPAAMQRVYSIRFQRNKGKLQVKSSSEGQRRWGQRSLMSLRSMNRSLDVGLPSPPATGPSDASGMGGALFRLTGRPACRAFLLTSVVMMMVLLTGIIIFLLTN